MFYHTVHRTYIVFYLLKVERKPAHRIVINIVVILKYRWQQLLKENSFCLVFLRFKDKVELSSIREI